MSVLLKCMIGNDQKYQEVVAIFDQIDSCDGSNLAVIDELKDKVQKALGQILDSEDGKIQQMVGYL